MTNIYCVLIRPRKNLMTVMRQSEVSRHEEDDLLPFIPDKPAKQRLQVCKPS